MLLFFFSSRRRHTRWPRDWSSDVCSSDLIHLHGVGSRVDDIPCCRCEQGAEQEQTEAGHLEEGPGVPVDVDGTSDKGDEEGEAEQYFPPFEERQVGELLSNEVEDHKAEAGDHDDDSGFVPIVDEQEPPGGGEQCGNGRQEDACGDEENPAREIRNQLEIE